MTSVEPANDITLRPVTLRADGVLHEAVLASPGECRGVVVLADEGDARTTPSLHTIAGALNAAHFATLTLDPLVLESERSVRQRITQLTSALITTLDWMVEYGGYEETPLTLLGRGLVAAAAIQCAAQRAEWIAGVVSINGRPDLAGAALLRCRAPVLLLVGEYDRITADANREALERLRRGKLVTIPQAGHRLDDSGAGKSADLIVDWLAAEPDAPTPH